METAPVPRDPAPPVPPAARKTACGIVPAPREHAGVRVARQTAFLRRAPGDFPQEERALRDEKVQFVREVYEYSRRAGVPEWKAAEHVAVDCAGFFPRLAEGGKNGASMLHYTNYRNWLTGTSKKPGLGRLADGSPDYGNADILLRNYGCEKPLYGDPAFWESFKAHYQQLSRRCGYRRFKSNAVTGAIASRGSAALTGSRTTILPTSWVLEKREATSTSCAIATTRH